MTNWFSQLKLAEQTGQPYVVATVVKSTGSTPRKAGAKMVVHKDGSIGGTVGGGLLESLILSQSLEAIGFNESRLTSLNLNSQTGQCCGGRVDVFIDVIQVKPVLYIFGAGHIGQALCQVLAGSDFVVNLIDEREEWVSKKEIPASVEIFHQDPIEFLKQKGQSLPENCSVVILTHSHALDFKILSSLISSSTNYLGVIGSHTKRARFEQQLTENGVSKERLTQFSCPMGEKIAGDNPHEIAISIAFDLIKKKVNSN